MNMRKEVVVKDPIIRGFVIEEVEEKYFVSGLKRLL